MTTFGGDFMPSLIGPFPMHPKQMMSFLDKLHINIGTLGNHEFDIGADRLQSVLKTSKFEWINSNVYFKKNHEPFIHPYVVYEIQGVKICLFGLLTTEAFNEEDPWNRSLMIEDPIKSAKQVIDKVKGNVDLVIAITHLPLDQDVALAAACPEISLILGAHDHKVVSELVGDIPILKAGKNVEYLGVLDLVFDKTARKLGTTMKMVSTYQVEDDPGILKDINALFDGGMKFEINT